MSGAVSLSESIELLLDKETAPLCEYAAQDGLSNP